MKEMEINFYQIDDVFAKSIAPLVLKILEEKKQAIIFVKDAARLKEIDDGLWSYGKNRFIPHATESEKALIDEFGLERQPIILTAREENFNKADYLIMLDEASNAFISGFARAFYFYDEMNQKQVADFAKKTGAKKINSYRKVEGKWAKSEL